MKRSNSGGNSIFIMLSFVLSAYDLSAAEETGHDVRQMFIRKVSSAWKPVPQNGIISLPGNYFLPENLSTERPTGINVQADNVTVDLAGHTLRYSGIPKEGTFGIIVNNRTDVEIVNGSISRFWFNIHCLESQHLKIARIRFDDIPYVAINVAQSRNATLINNTFSNFRYDLIRSKENSYLIGINIGGEDVTIRGNRFNAELNTTMARALNSETVFVLLSADESKQCVVAENHMTANYPLPRSYGVWLAQGAEATIGDNQIVNMQYGVCLSDKASAFVSSNRFVTRVADGTNSPLQTVGIFASSAKEMRQSKNSFIKITSDCLLPDSGK